MAVKQGVARMRLGYDDLYKNAELMIKSARRMTQVLIESGVIPAAPGDD